MPSAAITSVRTHQGNVPLPDWRSTLGGLGPLASHLVTPRRWYSHHGIHIGGGRVVHYAGLCAGVHVGPIEEVSLEAFADGNGFRVKRNPRRSFSGEEIARRARSRIGENKYHLFRNNCEHLCEWCIAGKSWSAQADAW